MRFITALIFLLGLGFPVLAEDRPTLTVTGQGVAVAAPDMATISIGVRRTASDAESAMAAVSDAMATLIERIGEQGVNPRDVQTSGLSLQPRYTRSNDGQAAPRISGYEAFNGVTVRVRKINAVGPLLGLLVSDGANSLDGIGFDVADPAPLLTSARQNAVHAATETAETLAEAAGLQLGAILSMVEGAGHGGGPILRTMAMEDAQSVPVAGGEISRTAHVTIIFALEGGSD